MKITVNRSGEFEGYSETHYTVGHIERSTIIAGTYSSFLDEFLCIFQMPSNVCDKSFFLCFIEDFVPECCDLESNENKY